MTADAHASNSALGLTLPAAYARFWYPDSGRLRACTDQLGGSSECLSEGLYAFLPDAGSPAVVERAMHFARDVIRLLGDDTCCLIYPGPALVSGADVQPGGADDLGEELAEERPDLTPGRVVLTGHALWELESRWIVDPAGEYRRPSGRSVNLVRLEGLRFDQPPWRNVEVLGRKPQRIEREIDRELMQLLSSEPVCAIVGSLGVGKTRLVVEAVHDLGAISLWAASFAARTLRPGIAHQLSLSLLANLDQAATPRATAALTQLRSLVEGAGDLVSDHDVAAALLATLDQLGDRRVVMVLDDQHIRRDEDSEVTNLLISAAISGAPFSVVLVGRPGGWIAPDAPQLTVPPMTSLEHGLLWDQLSLQLRLPSMLLERLQRSTAGLPFAAEEVLVQMARRRVLRRLYGSFFYSGPDDLEPESSSRMLRHFEAETRRLGPVDPLRVLALAPDGLAHDTELLADLAEADDDWPSPFIEAGLLEEIDHQGDRRIRFRAPIAATAMRSSLSPSTLKALRPRVVDREPGAGEPAASWDRYCVLAGRREAIPMLIELLKSSRTDSDPTQLFEAARFELEQHRMRDGDEGTELELLWGFLRMARRVGRLRNLDSALERALHLATDESQRQLALWTLRAEHAQNAGDLVNAEEYLRKALALATGKDPGRQSLLLIQLGKLLQQQERAQEAQHLFEELADRLEDSEHWALASACRYHLGNVHLQEQRFELALLEHRRALRARERLDLMSQVGQSLSAIGTTLLSRGEYAEALETYRRALTVIEEFGSEGETSYALLGMARILSRLGETTESISLARRGLELRTQLDDEVGEALARLDVADNHLVRGHLEAALTEARRSHFRLVLLQLPRYIGRAEQLLGRTFLHQNRLDLARQNLDAALRIHLRQRLLAPATFDLSYLLLLGLRQEDEQAVQSTIHRIEALMERLEYPERGEHIDLRLYRGLDWLRKRGRRVADPLPYLLRAQTQLMQRTAGLEPSLRHSFLFQVPDNRRIIETASQMKLAPPQPAERYTAE